MAFVYGLRAVESDNFFYIGSTGHSLEHQLRQHLDSIRLGCTRNLPLAGIVQKIGAANIRISAVEECADLARFDREYDMIQSLLSSGVPLVNVLHPRENYAYARLAEELDEFEVMPRHIESIVAALEGYSSPSHDPIHDQLADLIDATAWYMATRHLEAFQQLIGEVMCRHFSKSKAARLSAGYTERIAQALERLRDSEASGVTLPAAKARKPRASRSAVRHAAGD